MRIRVGYELTYNCPQETPMILVLNVHHSRGSDILIMESNHDVEMLRGGLYPWSVKQRVASNVGHLSNAKLADFFTGDYDNNAAFVVLAHLSEQNNHPEIARREAEEAGAIQVQ